jgi:hypothetical protein
MKVFLDWELWALPLAIAIGGPRDAFKGVLIIGPVNFAILREDKTNE